MADDMMQEGKETPPVAFETPKGSNVPTLSGWLAGEHATASAVKPGVDLFSSAGSTSSRALRFSLSPELADDETESLRKQVRSLTEKLQRANNEISEQASHQNGDNPSQEPSACLNCTDLRQDLAGLRETMDAIQQSLRVELVKSTLVQRERDALARCEIAETKAAEEAVAFEKYKIAYDTHTHAHTHTRTHTYTHINARTQHTSTPQQAKQGAGCCFAQDRAFEKKSQTFQGRHHRQKQPK